MCLQSIIVCPSAFYTLSPSPERRRDFSVIQVFDYLRIIVVRSNSIGESKSIVRGKDIRTIEVSFFNTFGGDSFSKSEESYAFKVCLQEESAY